MRKILVFLSAMGGAMFGLLFAPKSGRQLRKELKNTSDPKKIAHILGNVLMESGKNLAKELQHIKDTPAVKHKIAEFQETIEKETENLKKFIRNETEKAKKTASSRVKKAVKKTTSYVKKAAKRKKK